MLYRGHLLLEMVYSLRHTYRQIYKKRYIYLHISIYIYIQFIWGTMISRKKKRKRQRWWWVNPLPIHVFFPSFSLFFFFLRKRGGRRSPSLFTFVLIYRNKDAGACTQLSLHGPPPPPFPPRWMSAAAANKKKKRNIEGLNTCLLSPDSLSLSLLPHYRPALFFLFLKQQRRWAPTRERERGKNAMERK